MKRLPLLFDEKKNQKQTGAEILEIVNSQIQIQLWDNYNLIVSFLGVLKLHPQHKVKYPK